MSKQCAIKQQVLSFVQILCFVFAACCGCSVPPPKKNKHGATSLKTSTSATFPPCFSITTSLHYVGSNNSYRFQVYYCVEHDKQIHFVLRGHLGIEVIRGVINESGVTVLDRLHRVVHQWYYEQIKQRYHFHCNYYLLQSLLLGTTCTFRNAQGLLVTPSESRRYLNYTYGNTTGKVIGTQLMDRQGNYIRLLYKRSCPPSNDFPGISGIKIDFALNDNNQLYKGIMICNNLKVKPLSAPNIKLKVPSYYKHT